MEGEISELDTKLEQIKPFKTFLHLLCEDILCLFYTVNVCFFSQHVLRVWVGRRTLRGLWDPGWSTSVNAWILKGNEHNTNVFRWKGLDWTVSSYSTKHS